ncbi:MAG: DEAD/DEAH box helicase [Nanoarchaeota archaeon]
MIQLQTIPYAEKEIFSELHPVVAAWFKDRFGSFSPPQRFSILNIRRRINTLISSPTGSGKTLSAFLSVLNELVVLSEQQKLEDRIYCVYVSPLKALTRDIERNLNEPLAQLSERFKKDLPIRVSVRSGDTTASERASMLKKPPHILITTPESLAILLTTSKFVDYLKGVEWCIVDEIHAMASSKRGTHLALSLERLQSLSEFTRIGLSATVSPLEDVAKFLVGMQDEHSQTFRPCSIVDIQDVKKLDLKVISPVPNLIDTDYRQVNDKLYELLDDMIQSHRTTLVFTNTRSATERIVHHLKTKFSKHYMAVGEGDTDVVPLDDKARPTHDASPSQLGLIGAHHGSLSKELRLNIENRLKAGELKAVVCSTSLELGIDIGFIDLVILLGSPKSVARALQRIGRSGHKLHDTSKGRIVVLDRDDLVECSVLLKAAIEKKIDRISIPMLCLDVLSQQIFGIAIAEKILVRDLFAMCRKSYPFHDLSFTDFMEVIRYLSGEYASLEDRHVYAKIWFDEDTQMIGRKGRLARPMFMTNVGTIPDETNVVVKLKGHRLGSISEPFLEKLKRGDVFVLGGDTYEFLYAQGMTAFVKSSAGRPPTVPSWFSEMLPLSFDLAMEILKFRRFIDEMMAGAEKKEVLRFIHEYLLVDESSAESIYAYCKEQADYAVIPHDKRLVIEYFSEGSKKYVIFHSLYGRRVNDVLSRCVAFVIAKVTGTDVEIGINDNGFYLLSRKPIQAIRALKALTPDNIRPTAEQAIEKTEVLARRFRHCAARAMMILRNYKGREKSVGRQQVSSRLLINAVKRISPDFPILKEARREVLEDLMDFDGARQVIASIQDESLEIKEIYTEIPSPFAFGLIAQGYSDILRMEDKYAFLKRMHELVQLKIDIKKRKGE